MSSARWPIPIPVKLAGAASLASLLAALAFAMRGQHAWMAMLIVGAYLAGCAAELARHDRRAWKRKRMLTDQRADSADTMLVVYASQTGYAEQLALQSAQSLRSEAMPVKVLGLDQLDQQQLLQARHILFVVSTTGDGDAPDNAADFVRRIMTMRMPLQLERLGYGLLALGDRGYARYCAFGRQLEQWLQQQGAQALFDSIEVDGNDPKALAEWQARLVELGGADAASVWQTPRLERWTLCERRLLNPGSQGGGVYHIGLRPIDSELQWQAGDIVDIGPVNADADIERCLEWLGLAGTQTVLCDTQPTTLALALRDRQLPQEEELEALRKLDAQGLIAHLPPLPRRSYSIASLPADGQLELLVRRMQYPDGRLGIGSGWLTEHAEIGAEIALHVRANRSFHPPEDDRPLILIGSGTGIAGLRAHLKHRAARGHRRNWLLFGERSAKHDFFHNEEICGWQRQGVLQRLDLAFSRDQPQRLYVQEKLLAAQAELRAWVAQGAAIYVCGSLAGMATDVAATLHSVLGQQLLDHLRQEGRYRRDVY